MNVAGGLRLTEPAVDLPLACALYSARSGQALPEGSAIAGELSLAGEVRPVLSMERRAKAASQLGFTRIIGPKAALPGEEVPRARAGKAGAGAGVGAGQSVPSWRGVSSLREALRILWNQENRT